ncbi:sigma-70 family RNA polymerase sigma factor [Pseudomonas purpurea]|uniref:sigma-70 family RNA polymerase sigma factor n=1 Tax=Pseudomonas purpurea TaxID=3136737 RepID=UPI003263D7DF
MPVADSCSVSNLYTSHHRWLYELLRRRLSNAFDAADLVHDTFIRVLKRPQAFECEVHERSYLATIARGLCIDHWRRRQLEQAWLQALAERPQALQPSPEHRAIIVETLHEVDAMLQRLPARVRDAFVLAQLQGMPYKTIAIEIGVSERMVKKYLAQALMHCALLEAELDGLLIE